MAKIWQIIHKTAHCKQKQNKGKNWAIMSKVSQNKLFEDSDNPELWKEEWVDMPEFVQWKQEKPYAQIIFRFANENDLKEFSDLIGQKLTKKTKSAWHPQIERGLNANKIYVYEP